MNSLFEEIEIEKENSSDVKKITIYDKNDKNIENYDYMYVLEIGEKKEICKVCYTLMPLIKYVSVVCDWSHNKWKIYKLIK